MKVLVVGAGGLLGSELVPALARGHDVTATGRAELDVRREKAVRDFIRNVGPEVVVNCAAYTNVDGAESAFEEAFAVNAAGPRNLALAARDVGARLIHVSTDYVFDGRAGRPYVESDPANPEGVYARSKWMGEQLVREIGGDFSIVRTQALYGPTGPSFLKAILARVDAGEPLRVVDDQFVAPTRAGDLAEALRRILEDGGPGTWHASANGECSWYEFAQAILAEIGRPEHPLAAISTAELGRPAPRPPASVLRNLHLEMTIGDTLPHWRVGLRTHLAAIGRHGVERAG